MTEVTEHSELPPSSADKWMNCGAWRRLVHGLPNPSSPAAEEGTIAHKWLSDHLTGEADINDCPDEDMADYVLSVIDWVEQETKPGVDRFVEQRVDYGKAFDYEDLTGTADIILAHPDHLTIADLKYGRGIVEVENNLQLMCYLVGAVQSYGKRDRYRMVILQPRPWHLNGPIREAWISHWKLEGFMDDLAEAIRANYDPKSRPIAGDWCRHYCLALGRCPAATQKTLDLLRSTPVGDDE